MTARRTLNLHLRHNIFITLCIFTGINDIYCHTFLFRNIHAYAIFGNFPAIFQLQHILCYLLLRKWNRGTCFRHIIRLCCFRNRILFLRLDISLCEHCSNSTHRSNIRRRFSVTQILDIHRFNPKCCPRILIVHIRTVLLLVINCGSYFQNCACLMIFCPFTGCSQCIVLCCIGKCMCFFAILFIGVYFGTVYITIIHCIFFFLHQRWIVISRFFRELLIPDLRSIRNLII